MVVVAAAVGIQQIQLVVLVLLEHFGLQLLVELLVQAVAVAVMRPLVRLVVLVDQMAAVLVVLLLLQALRLQAVTVLLYLPITQLLSQLIVAFSFILDN
jgi:hypothetical protein